MTAGSYIPECEILVQNMSPCANLHISIYSDSLKSTLYIWVFTPKSVEDFIQCSRCKVNPLMQLQKHSQPYETPTGLWAKLFS